MGRLLRWFVVGVWVHFGLLCKILGLVDHQRIVEAIVATATGLEFASLVAPALTLVIGVGELAVAVWTLTGRFHRANVIFQITLVFVMNVVEFLLVPELLLFGHLNLLVALAFCAFLYWWGFMFEKTQKRSAHHAVG